MIEDNDDENNNNDNNNNNKNYQLKHNENNIILNISKLITS